MPTITPPEKILVTGANGYLGLWVTKLLLERGYSVRGVVRNKEKGDTFVRTLEQKLPAKVKNLEYVLVQDITAVSVLQDLHAGLKLMRLLRTFAIAGPRVRRCRQRRDWDRPHRVSAFSRHPGRRPPRETGRGRHARLAEERPRTWVCIDRSGVMSSVV